MVVNLGPNLGKTKKNSIPLMKYRQIAKLSSLLACWEAVGYMSMRELEKEKRATTPKINRRKATHFTTIISPDKVNQYLHGNDLHLGASLRIFIFRMQSHVIGYQDEKRQISLLDARPRTEVTSPKP